MTKEERFLRDKIAEVAPEATDEQTVWWWCVTNGRDWSDLTTKDRARELKYGIPATDTVAKVAEQVFGYEEEDHWPEVWEIWHEDKCREHFAE